LYVGHVVFADDSSFDVALVEHRGAGADLFGAFVPTGAQRPVNARPEKLNSSSSRMLVKPTTIVTVSPH
jgi:hypothetical protein